MANHARDISGQEFGHLTAVRPAGRSTRYGVVWVVRCRCGTEIEMGMSDLVSKPRRPGQMPRSCGCYRKRNRGARYKGAGELSHTRWHYMMKGAVGRGIPIEITIQQAWDLFEAQGRKCALTGVLLSMDPVNMHTKATTASLDRIDSARGYLLDNVQWVHRDINFMKQALAQEVFVSWCQAVAKHSRRRSA
jgi:hypothetical protein